MTAQDTENAQLPVGQIWREAYGFVFSVPLRVVLTALIPLGLYSLAATWIQVQFHKNSHFPSIKSNFNWFYVTNHRTN